MNVISIILLILSSVTYSMTQEQFSYNEKELKQFVSKNMIRTGIKSLIIGAGIGTGVGVANAFWDNYIPFYTIEIGWMIAWMIRHELTDLVIRDLHKIQCHYNRNIIEWSGWLLSWISYIHLYRSKKPIIYRWLTG